MKKKLLVEVLYQLVLFDRFRLSFLWRQICSAEYFVSCQPSVRFFFFFLWLTAGIAAYLADILPHSSPFKVDSSFNRPVNAAIWTSPFATVLQSQVSGQTFAPSVLDTMEELTKRANWLFKIIRKTLGISVEFCKKKTIRQHNNFTEMVFDCSSSASPTSTGPWRISSSISKWIIKY